MDCTGGQQCDRLVVNNMLALCASHLYRYRRFNGETYPEIPIGDPALRRLTSTGPSRRSKVGIRGVRRLPSGRWDTRVVVDGKVYTAGVFDRVEDAAAAVAALRAELLSIPIGDNNIITRRYGY
jgi:hypothetical protein